MDLAIVTGMSGAGKTSAINALEDMGYYCVDNVPPSLVAKFAEIPAQSGGKIARIAVVVDVRSHKLFDDYVTCLDELKTAKIAFKTLFLDCDDSTIMRRFKETRRRHPLLEDGADAMETAIRIEREILHAAKSRADFILDTSRLSVTAMKNEIKELFGQGTSQSILVSIYSFGFKHSYPGDADLLFDVRCLPNPYYIEQLRDQTGLENDVRDYVLSFPQAQGLIPKLTDLVDYLLPLYVSEGKSLLVIAIGCTGGKHRSVVFAQLLGQHLAAKGNRVHIAHRDIDN